jgi:hypothetical protein
MRNLAVWLFRLSWAALVFTTGPAIGDALSDHSRAVQYVGTIGAWVAWGVVLLVSLVPTTVSLTVLRTITPASIAVGVIAWSRGASVAAGITAVALGVVATLLGFSGDIGETFAQGSAYGHERRLPLRPPGPLLFALPPMWGALIACALVGPLALAARSWALGAVLSAAAVALAVPLSKRFHRLSKRWLVLVPAGVVLHDHFLLAETNMMAKGTVASAGLALVGTEAANFTGNALGPVVEVRLSELTTFVLAAPPRGQTKALHVQSFLISPTRPGRALRALHELGVAATGD